MKKVLRLVTLAVAACAALAMAPSTVLARDDCNCSRPKPRPKPVHHRVVRSDGIHDGSWMQKQGFRTCGQVKSSCDRGANKRGHGFAYGGVCEARFATCMDSGCWSTTNTGSICGLARY